MNGTLNVVGVDGKTAETLLAERGRALRQIAANSITRVHRTDLQFALRCLVDRAGLELERLAIAPGDAEQAARAVRNCFEANLITRYILASKDNLLNLYSLSGQERADVLSNALKLSVTDPEGLAETRQAIERQIADYAALREKHGLPKAVRLPKWSKLAEEFGLKDKYDGLYSLFSKYVHPSALNIFPQDKESASIVAGIFTARAQVYAFDLTSQALEALGLDRAILSSGAWQRTE